MQATGAHLGYVVTGGQTSAGTDRAYRADRLPKFENSSSLWYGTTAKRLHVCTELMLGQVITE